MSQRAGLTSGCKGTVTLKPFQQKQQLGIGLSPKLEWLPYGFRPDSTVIAYGKERVVMRAARLCWSLSIGGGRQLRHQAAHRGSASGQEDLATTKRHPGIGHLQRHRADGVRK
jgi:hypothetical protein